jgi:hypothetical protein
MFKTAAVPIISVACAVLAGVSTSKAQQLTTPTRLSEDAWHNHGWGFAGPGVYNEKDPSKRKRLAGLLHMAHVYAAAQLCPALRNTLSGFPSAAAMALGLATFVPANPALAATFANTDAATITLTGKIDHGDEQKFVGALGYAPNFRKLVVNSPGGSILPAYLIGRGLRTGSYEVQVADNGECVSACTLLLAAAAERSAYGSSRIAVHSASTFEADGTRKPETDDDLAVSAKLARHMTEWGTPAGIIGKMIGTPANKTTPLTDSDLQAWNVRILTARYSPPTPYTPPPYEPPPIVAGLPDDSAPFAPLRASEREALAGNSGLPSNERLSLNDSYRGGALLHARRDVADCLARGILLAQRYSSNLSGRPRPSTPSARARRYA